MKRNVMTRQTKNACHRIPHNNLLSQEEFSIFEDLDQRFRLFMSQYG